ncbi:MAG: AAA family ATPase, partial [Pseudomonadota bacterium]
MRQLIMIDDVAFRDLEKRAKSACICFRNREMPPKYNPNRADVGFEIDINSGLVSLYVTRGITYGGNDPAVRTWLRDGVKIFNSFADLKAWLQGSFRESFNIESGTSVVLPDASQLTDLIAVQEALRNTDHSLYLDETTLFDRLREKVLGQDSALRALTSVIVRHCARRLPARPAVVFAVGPSGVGKTRSIEVLAEVLRDINQENQGYQFLRLDMSEYQEAHRVSQLLGAPPGYIGHGHGSQLIDALRANPETIVLFDEIEKAHPAILRTLMNAMDAGRLSSASRAEGEHEVNCKRSVFTFTSNVDANSIIDELETRNAFGNSMVEDDVCRRRLHASGIPAEIVGRIGRFLVYRP